jgi:hypothetical protein
MALLFSRQKFPVTGFDIDRRRVDVLESAGLTFTGSHLPKSSPARALG